MDEITTITISLGALQPPSLDQIRLIRELADPTFRMNYLQIRSQFTSGSGSLFQELSDEEADRIGARLKAAKITRLLRLLRGHGLIQKVPKTHRYTLTESGHQTLTSLQIAQQSSTQKLAKLAV